MQTLNFQCGHCRGLMAVGKEFLGQQVRCPHCQQVVIAPQAAAPELAPPEPGPALTAPDLNIDRHEDIFSQNQGGEDLFGTSEGPKLDVPLQPIQPQPAPEAPAPLHQSPANGASEPAPEVVQVPAYTHTPEHANGEAAPWPRPAAVQEQAAVQQEQAAASPQHVSTQPAPVEEAAYPSVRKPREAEGGFGLLVPFLILPLLLWALAATAIAYFLYNRLVSQPTSPFEQFPDNTGDTPGVKQEKVVIWGPKRALRRLPEKLVVGLKGTIVLGALQVTPLSVKRKRVRVFTEGAEKPEPLPHDSLVLTLRVKNLAEDYAFAPADNYFDRKSNGKGRSVPLTILQAGKENFFGGPAKWYPRQGAQKRWERGERREWVEGRADEGPFLQPGQSTETIVCTDGADVDAASYLFGVDKTGKKVGGGYSGKMLWRVQLRRGLIDYNGRQLPAQCVIGVRFDSKDIEA